MLNAYPIKFPSLSKQLIQDLLTYTNQICFDSMYDPIVNFDQFELDQTSKYYVNTNTLQSSYKAVPILTNLKKRIKLELKNNIFPINNLSFYLQVVTGGTSLAPHRDTDRILNIMCNLTNDQATTNFYDQLISGDRYLFAPDEITEPIETHNFQFNSWYIFNNQKIHSVTNLNKLRVALVANIDLTYKEFIKLYKDNLLIF